jgi:hypothetical protein
MCCFHRAMARTPCDIAHDFAGVITVIGGSVELARRELDASHPASGHLDRIVGAAEEAARLTQELRAAVCVEWNTPESLGF